ncbi:hypothetical protein F5051DRAFT_456670 [Lentinula edodes]|nr:hypothetical protein F5051DRAFT_456670 [Lentinula edodes]
MLYILSVLAIASSQIVKWVLIAIALLNCRSWPLIWNVRVFLPVAKYFLASWIFNLNLLFVSRKHGDALRQERKSRMSCLGRNPLEITTSYHSWAGFDDCDYNLHMSNSVYPKILDMVRMKAVIEHFPLYLRTGGVLVLSGTHFDFIREIPMLARYETRVSIASWDDKQLYLIARFVTVPVKKEHQNISDSDPKKFNASLGALILLKEPDGATVHCVSINQFIFKQGRITVPPALALACEGYANLSLNNQKYSLTDPPPHWSHVKEVMKTGGAKALSNYMKSWKTVPEHNRWWKSVFNGAIEDQRAAHLSLIQGVWKGMQGARSIISDD